jgi:hypothetical protein
MQICIPNPESMKVQRRFSGTMARKSGTALAREGLCKWRVIFGYC